MGASDRWDKTLLGSIMLIELGDRAYLYWLIGEARDR